MFLQDFKVAQGACCASIGPYAAQVGQTTRFFDEKHMGGYGLRALWALLEKCNSVLVVDVGTQGESVSLHGRVRKGSRSSEQRRDRVEKRVNKPCQ